MMNSSLAGSEQLIYVLDDEKMIAWTLSLILQQNGYQARWFSDANNLLHASLSCPPALVVSDVAMPEMSGFELAGVLRSSQPTCNVLLFSGQAHTLAVELPTLTRDAFEVLAKPISPAKLLSRVAHLLSVAKGT